MWRWVFGEAFVLCITSCCTLNGLGFSSVSGASCWSGGSVVRSDEHDTTPPPPFLGCAHAHVLILKCGYLCLISVVRATSIDAWVLHALMLGIVDVGCF